MSEQEYDKEQLRILRNAFKAFDHDERGYIEHSDVQTILEILGQKLDEKAIKALIKEVDKGSSGKLDFSQFCRLAARFVEVEEDVNALASELKEAFRVYDKEGKGYLTVQTLRDILHELDDKLSNNDLDMIIEEIDADGSGTVDFDEFMQVMTGKNYHDFFVKRHFAFESNQSPHLPHGTCTSPHCHCPARRMRLHRRIESHFERFFKQLLQQFEPLPLPPTPTLPPPPPPLPLPIERPSRSYESTKTYHRCISSSRAPAAAAATAAPVITGRGAPAKPIVCTTKMTTSSASASASASTSAQCSAAAAAAAKRHSACCCCPSSTTTSTTTSSAQKATNTTTTTTITKCSHYKPVFRARFPKWVPIFTLYREMLQNPFRHRRHMMITH